MQRLIGSLVISLWIGLIHGLPVDDMSPPVVQIPTADGLLHVYQLPVGQGDGQVIQCPNGDLTIMDLGTSDDVAAGFWATSEIKIFLGGSFNRIVNVILSHNHFDHYSLMATVMSPNEAMSGLQNVYVTCTYGDLVASIQTWLAAINAENKVRLFNNGNACGPYNNAPCEGINLCPSDAGVTTNVLSVNVGQQCVTGNKNIDSIVFKVSYGGTSVIFNGDFEDFTSADNEDGPQKALVDFFGTEMETTIYKLSHHGASNLANKPISQSAHVPRAIFVSGNPWYSYRHPRCMIIDGFLNDVGSLCRPNIDCGPHPISSTPAADQLQEMYTCGEETGTTPDKRPVSGNQYAIFTSVPTQSIMNLIILSIDGANGNWGFTVQSSPYARK